MLVRLPDTSEAVEGKHVYKVFNVHFNASYHCSLRYSQLLAFSNEVCWWRREGERRRREGERRRRETSFIVC